MSTPVDDPGTVSAERIRALHEARALAELTAADRLAPGSDAVAWRGALLAEVAVVKGLPGPAESTGGAALTGADGEAAAKSLERLGYDPASAFYTLSRPEPGIERATRVTRLKAQLAAVDPDLVIALDAEAAQDVAEALGIAKPAFGTVVGAGGTRMVACDGLEASLGDERNKQRVWRQLKVAAPRGPVY